MMKNYIGVKYVQAEPMTDYEFYDSRKQPYSTENGERKGYKVVYPDGYVSWSPKDVFERAYMQVGDNNTITQDNVDDFISEIQTIQLGDKTTIVKATLNNGFVIVESSSCVDPKNFDLEIGRDICVEHIKDKIWAYLGFVLSCGANGIKGD